MSARRRWLLPAALVTTLACTQAFAPVEQLVTPRVLAIRSDPVELLPDAGVTLQALIYVPGDALGSTASYAWSWCPQQGSASENYACALTSDALANALDPDGGLAVSYDAGTTASVYFGWPISQGLLQSLCASAPTFNADAGDAGDAGDDVGADAGSDGGSTSTLRLLCNGGLTVTLSLALVAGGATVTAELPLTAVFSQPALLNTNPSIHAVSARPDGGAAVRSSGQLVAGQTYTLTAELLAGTSEAYTQTFGGGGADAGTDAGDQGGFGGAARTVTVLEGLSIAWYVEQGTLSQPTTTLAPGELDDAGLDGRDAGALLTNSWTIPSTSRGTVKVIAVIRDTRNGVGWVQSSFDVQGAP